MHNQYAIMIAREYQLETMDYLVQLERFEAMGEAAPRALITAIRRARTLSDCWYAIANDNYQNQPPEREYRP